MKLKKLFSLKWILLFSMLLILGSFIQKSSPVIQPDTPFIYEFGIALPWVRIYMDKGYGLLYFWECLLHKGYLGIEIFPQYILLCAVVLNLLLSFKNWNAVKENTATDGKGNIFKENVRGENQGAVLCVYASAGRPVFSLPVSII